MAGDITILARRAEGSGALSISTGSNPPLPAKGVSVSSGGGALVQRLDTDGLSAISAATLVSGIRWDPEGREAFFNWRPARLEESLGDGARLRWASGSIRRAGVTNPW
jgi:hypothetical protein